MASLTFLSYVAKIKYVFHRHFEPPMHVLSLLANFCCAIKKIASSCQRRKNQLQSEHCQIGTISCMNEEIFLESRTQHLEQKGLLELTTA